jgi:hypothetical protein
MSSPPRPFIVAGRFCGPAGSGNGGYTSGRLAAHLAWNSAEGMARGRRPVTVTLRRPPPVDTMMSVRDVPDAGSGVEIWEGDQLVASAVPGAFESGVVPRVDFDTATGARNAYRGNTHHPFPGCFVCGPEREPSDGLRLTPGIVEEGRTACVWVPDPSLATGADPAVVGSEFAWAALDCPGGWTSDLEHRPMVLGRMTASCPASPRVGRPHIVVGRLLREEGRKTFTATSLYDGDHLVGRAEHTWIAVDPSTFPPG